MFSYCLYNNVQITHELAIYQPWDGLSCSFICVALFQTIVTPLLMLVILRRCNDAIFFFFECRKQLETGIYCFCQIKNCCWGNKTILPQALQSLSSTPYWWNPVVNQPKEKQGHHRVSQVGLGGWWLAHMVRWTASGLLSTVFLYTPHSVSLNNRILQYHCAFVKN